jgi:hypothetical protein
MKLQILNCTAYTKDMLLWTEGGETQRKMKYKKKRKQGIYQESRFFKNEERGNENSEDRVS